MNIRYNFHGPRSRAKVISFQPVPPLTDIYYVIVMRIIKCKKVFAGIFILIENKNKKSQQKHA